MKLKDEGFWDSIVEANKDDSYGSGIVRYTESWADIMEAQMESGESLVDIASETSDEADTEGISGFMYTRAVGTLIQCWEHGDELEAWFNEHSIYGRMR